MYKLLIKYNNKPKTYVKLLLNNYLIKQNKDLIIKENKIETNSIILFYINKIDNKEYLYLIKNLLNETFENKNKIIDLLRYVEINLEFLKILKDNLNFMLQQYDLYDIYSIYFNQFGNLEHKYCKEIIEFLNYNIKIFNSNNYISLYLNNKKKIIEFNCKLIKFNNN